MMPQPLPVGQKLKMWTRSLPKCIQAPNSAKHTGGAKDLGQTIAVEAGKTYTLSFWYKVVESDGTDARIWCVWNDADGNGLFADTQGSIRGPDGGYLSNGSGEWLQHTAEVVAPAAAASLYLEVRTYSGAVTYWDDFVFEEYIDVAAPVVTFDPEDGTENVSIAADIVLSFDEPVFGVGGTEITDPAALVELKETDASGADVAFTAVINAEKTEITITPDANLTNEQLHYVALKANVVEDEAGNVADAVQSATFTTSGPIEILGIEAGDVVYIGQEVVINWMVEETIGNITIWVSFDNGVTFEALIENIDPAPGFVDYTISETFDPSMETILRITEATNTTFAEGEPMAESEVIYLLPLISVTDIQGTTEANGNSSYEDTLCVTTGVVTFADGSSEYYIADGTGDYSGVVVRDNQHIPAIGDSILIAGEVDEYYSLTQINNLIKFEIIASGKTVPAPVSITTGGASEALEGVIVQVSSAVVVKETNSYGETEVDDGSGVILVDDPYHNPTLNLDGTYDITGPLSYSYSKWRIYPTSAADVTEILSDAASVTSETYTVDDVAETITGVPAKEELATFIDNVIPVYGATIAVYEADGTTAATDLQTGYQLIVTSQDESTTKTYTITKDPLSDDATVTSLVYTVDDAAGTITGVLYNSTVASFEAYLVPAAGATFTTFATDGTTEATDIQSGYKLIVTAEDESTTKTYELTVDDALPADLIFSEYIEGSGNNKAIEVFNPNEEAIKLDYYQIAQLSNGGDDWEYFHLFPTGTVLEAGANWVMLNNETDETLFAAENADEVLSYPSVVHHNGDDARGLIIVTGLDTTLVDIIGTIGPDPGDGWDVAGITNATKDHTLIRKGTVSEGNTDWSSSAGTTADNSEWIVMDQNFLDSLGSHTLVLPLPSDDATLSDLMVDGTSVNGFSPATLTYYVTLPAGTTDVPAVTAETTDENASVNVIDATDLGGDAAARTTTVEVTAEDGETVKTYTIEFTVQVGVHDEAFNMVQLYPVPAVNTLYIDNVANVRTVTMFDITGAAVMQMKNAGNDRIAIDVSSLEGGLYLIKMANEQATGVARFVKQ
jgi:hypothetical protein